MLRPPSLWGFLWRRRSPSTIATIGAIAPLRRSATTAAPPPQAQRPQRPDYRPDHRPGYRPDYRPAPLPYYQGGRGVGSHHNWHRGSRIPPAYRTRHYVVNDWRSHRLSAPPRGHYWVQNGADYLLVAIATGVIAQIIMSR